MTHAQWVRAGDVVHKCGEWLITAVFVIVAAFSGAVLGVTAFLFLLSLAGKALT